MKSKYTFKNLKTGEERTLVPVENTTTLQIDEIVKSNGEEWKVVAIK